MQPMNARAFGVQGFEVFRQSSTTSEPSECSLDLPASRKNLKVFRVIGALHYFSREMCETLFCSSENRGPW